MAYASETRTTGKSLGLNLGGLWASLTERYTKYSVYRATVAELDALTDRELADLGLHRSQLRDVAYEAAYGEN
jgi:uncharacterized protein YjiS (DUF1127 family)